MIQYYDYTILVIIKLLFYTRATGTGMGVAWVRVQAQPGIQLQVCQEYSYRGRTDMALRGVMQLQSMPLCGISH